MQLQAVVSRAIDAVRHLPKPTGKPVLIGIAVLIAALVAFVVTRDGAGPDVLDKSAMYEGPVGAGEGSVRVLAWPGYIENGSTDPRVDWITAFENQSGCKVSVTTYGTPDQAVELFNENRFDVIAAPGSATLQLARQGRIQPLNTALLNNWKDLFEDLKSSPSNSVDGVVFGAPQGRVSNVLMYRTDIVDPAPDSWSEIWNSTSAFAGKISAYDSPLTIADAALFLMNSEPDLLITDPYSLDAKQFQRAVDLLKAQSKNVYQYWSDYAAQLQAFQAGNAVLGSTWQVIVNLAKEQGDPINAVSPKEGSTGWSDSWSINVDTPHINCSYLFVDHMISPAANASVAEWFGQAPSNTLACDVTTNPNHCATYRAADTEYWASVYYWTAPQEQCADGRTEVTCVPYSDWIKAWNTQIRVQ